MTDTPRPPASSGAPRWMRWLLVASLAVNLFVLALAIGAAWRVGGPGEPRFRAQAVPGSAYARALAPEDRRAIRDGMFADRDAFRREIRSQRAAQARLLDALRAEPFDPEAIRVHIATQTEAANARLSRSQALLVERLLGMSAQERRAYADRLEQRLRRRGTNGRRDD